MGGHDQSFPLLYEYYTCTGQKTFFLPLKNRGIPSCIRYCRRVLRPTWPHFNTTSHARTSNVFVKFEADNSIFAVRRMQTLDGQMDRETNSKLDAD